MGLTPTQPYEDLLGDRLEALLGAGVDTIDGFVEGLNQAGVHGPRGQRWTPAVLSAEPASLGPGEPLQTRVTEPAHQRTIEPLPQKPKTPEDLLELGILNLWYLVARASDVTDRPVALTRLSRDLVLWRGEKGEINVLEDCCPHRGTPLSMGQVAAGNVMCAYHGVRVTGEGIVAAVPPTPNSSLVGQKLVKAYPCREFAGAIWVYFGDEAHERAFELHMAARHIDRRVQRTL